MDSGCSYTIIMVTPVLKTISKKYSLMQWHTQDVNITTNINIDKDITLTELGVKKIISAKGIYNMILGRYLLTEVVLNLKWSDHVIEVDDGPFKVSIEPMVDLGMYGFKYLNTW